MEKKMSMTEILSAKKMYKKRLSELDSANFYIDLIKEGEKSSVALHLSKEEAEEKIVSSFTSDMAILKNYEKLNMIKNNVNNVLKITIGGRTYTVSEAIALQSEDIKSKYKKLISLLRQQYTNTMDTKSRYEAKQFSEENVNNYLKAVFGDTSAKSTEDIKTAIETHRKINEIHVIDPLKIKDKLDELSKWYDEFYDEINFKLSEINATTFIYVDLDKDEDYWRFVE